MFFIFQNTYNQRFFIHSPFRSQYQSEVLYLHYRQFLSSIHHVHASVTITSCTGFCYIYTMVGHLLSLHYGWESVILTSCTGFCYICTMVGHLLFLHYGWDSVVITSLLRICFPSIMNYLLLYLPWSVICYPYIRVGILLS